MKKNLIILLCFLVGIFIGIPIEVGKTKINLEYNEQLTRGTYSTIDNRSDYILTVESDNNTFVLYKDCKLYDSGEIRMIKANSFLLKGKKTEYHIYYIIEHYLVLYEENIDFIFFDNYGSAVITYR